MIWARKMLEPSCVFELEPQKLLCHSKLNEQGGGSCRLIRADNVPEHLSQGWPCRCWQDMATAQDPHRKCHGFRVLDQPPPQAWQLLQHMSTLS